eukprot:scaffold1637_cov118-Skeletonema_dohrnii-CCMP3373.AAC.11
MLDGGWGRKGECSVGGPAAHKAYRGYKEGSMGEEDRLLDLMQMMVAMVFVGDERSSAHL